MQNKSSDNEKMNEKNVLNLIMIFFCMSFLCISSVFGEDINSYEYLKVNIDNEIYFGIEKSPNYEVNYFNVKSHFFPKTIPDNQYLNSFETNFKSYSYHNETINPYLEFKYNTQTLKEANTIKNKFIVESIIFEPEIKKKEPYPIEDVSKDNEKYLQFYDLIDINENIKNKASELAKNKDDTFLISVAIANWIQNEVKYDLSTVANNPNQKSTETFSLKTGVCKEITNLFVSMMRSLGVPARVVSGYAYTTSEDVVKFVGDNWGGHAWAEIYIDGKWVPFDLTYNQYGYVDASHIVLKQDEKNNVDSVSINGSGIGFAIEKNSLKTTTKFTIIDQKEKITTPRFSVMVSGPDKIGFDSYGYLKIDAENLRDSYQVLNYHVAKTKEVEALDPVKNIVVLKPGETKTMYFRYKIPDLNSGMRYTFPFSVSSDDFEANYEIYSQEDYLKIKEVALPAYEEEQIVLTNNNLKIDCAMILNVPKNNINCEIKNPNNYEINNLEICFDEKDCKTLNLRLNEAKTITSTTGNFSSKISYNYDEKEGDFEISLKRPILNSNSSYDGEYFALNYEIENHGKGLKINVYNENGTIIETSSLEKGKIEILLEKENPTYFVKLEFGDTVFYEKEYKIETKGEVEKRIEEENSVSFLKRILLWILSFFN